MWWCMPVIPALGRQRQVDFWVRGQPGLHSEFQERQGYTEKPCLKKNNEFRIAMISSYTILCLTKLYIDYIYSHIYTYIYIIHIYMYIFIYIYIVVIYIHMHIYLLLSKAIPHNILPGPGVFQPLHLLSASPLFKTRPFWSSMPGLT